MVDEGKADEHGHVGSPNLRIMFCRWDSTVRGEMLKSEAISLVEKPSTMSCRTSFSRGVRSLTKVSQASARTSSA